MKSAIALFAVLAAPVAPLVGAWIEVFIYWIGDKTAQVAPLVGAWIEVILLESLSAICLVAPLVGAWIEVQNEPVYTHI